MSTLSTFELLILVLLAVVAALFLGYAAGRRTGLMQGQRIGKAQAPLSLRRQALKNGQCPVCDSYFQGRPPNDRLIT